MPLTKQEHLRRIEKKYRLASGAAGPLDLKLVAAWALRQGMWKPHDRSLISQCARELAGALRNDYFTDSKGRRVRAKHPVKERHSGKTIGLWDDIRTASRRHMEVSFTQRREQIVGDCRQLKTDVDSYNDAHADNEPIQLVLDFTMDVAELEAGRDNAA